jgi:hypothetical protein
MDSEDILQEVEKYLLRQQAIYAAPNKGDITAYGRGARDAVDEILDFINYCKLNPPKAFDNDF